MVVTAAYVSHPWALPLWHVTEVVERRAVITFLLAEIRY